MLNKADEIWRLAVQSDRSPTFVDHVSKPTCKGIRLAELLRSLTRCIQGPKPDLLTTIIRAVALPSIMYAAEVMWQGTTREIYRGLVRNSMRRKCKDIDQATMAEIRAALPARRTAPTTTTRREFGIPPAQILLERRIQSAARIRRLERKHPLRIRALESIINARHRLGLQMRDRSRLGMDRIHDFRVQRTFRLLPASEPLLSL